MMFAYRLGLGILAACGAVFGSVGADAALKKLRLNTINIVESPHLTPMMVEKVGAEGPPQPPFDAAFIDDGTPGTPVLRKLRFKSQSTTTVDLLLGGPAGSTIFLANNFIEGPGPLRKPNSFTGSGHTAGGSTIEWPLVTGWTITGAQYCKSSPQVICNFGQHASDTTTDPAFHSDFYDLGTWTFHGTGFTASPFVHQYFTVSGAGNNQRWVRGFFLADANVPALPLVGLALLAGGIVLGGATAVRRRP